MRPTWSGMISFGLVNIPVGLYTATEDHEISFHLLHKEDNGRIKNQRECTKCGKAVEYDDLVRGFEYEKGHYLTLSDEDLKAVTPKTSEGIDIMDFVDVSEIDPIYFDKPYYIAPDKKSGKAYALLLQALKVSNKVGIANLVMRTKEHLAAVQAHDDILILYTLHFADEIRSHSELPRGESEVGERELGMAKMLIDNMTGHFEPEKYKDTYTEQMTEMINKKLAGEDIKIEDKQVEATNVIDLMEFLKASIEKTERSDKKASPVETPPEKKPSRKKAAA
jgi:DNA end-binding protein Ku